jgi:hypothetical protein
MRECILIFSLSFFFIFKAQAYINFSTLEWHKGAIVLSSHDVVTGEVSYNSTYDIVLQRSEGRVQTFTAAQVNYFHIINKQTGQLRRFVTLPHQSSLNFLYERSYFFEILLSGEVTFLRKSNKNRGFLQQAQRSKLNLDNLCYDYYMLHNENLISIKNFEKDALPLLAHEDSKSIHDYIEARNIRKFTPRNQLVVIYFYNIMHEADKDPHPRLVQRMELSK